MSYQEDRQVRLRRLYSKQAIALAMEGRWREAVAANKRITASFPHDVDAHNRLGRAHMKLGEYSPAREAYSRAMELDPANTIADKNLHRLSLLEEAAVSARGDPNHVEPHHFIEEIGKAEVVDLRHLAPAEVLVRIAAGDAVHLRIDGTNLVVENGYGEYLGQLKPKHMQLLIKLMKGGNQYSAAVVSSSEDKLLIIIRESYQHPSQAGRLSFPPRELERLQPDVSRRIPGLESEEEEISSKKPPDIYDEASNEE